jgi:hypothetical protein
MHIVGVLDKRDRHERITDQAEVGQIGVIDPPTTTSPNFRQKGNSLFLCLIASVMMRKF